MVRDVNSYLHIAIVALVTLVVLVILKEIGLLLWITLDSGIEPPSLPPHPALKVRKTK